MNLISGSLTRVAPMRATMNPVHLGMNQSITQVTMTNTRSQILKLAKIRPNASTVPRSLMKQAASIIFPNGVSHCRVSIMTA